MKITKFLIIPLLLYFGSGCTRTAEWVDTIGDPTERGLVYVAFAIIAAAFIRGLFNK